MNAESIIGLGSQNGAAAGLALPFAASINGIPLQAPGDDADPQTLRERAVTELLRQQAIKLGLLPDFLAPTYVEPDEAQRQTIESMVDAAVTTPDPTDDECLRHYESQKSRLVVGQALHVRHILFAVTPGINVTALAQRAEAALLELKRKDASAGRFEQLAAELSNCPSSAQGGDLGWLTPEDCAPELAKAFFFQTDTRLGLGVHPRLVHSRYGLHIIEVLDHRAGTLPDFSQVRPQIAARLAQQSRATAMRQYLKLLVGQAKVEGVALEGAETPLVQ